MALNAKKVAGGNTAGAQQEPIEEGTYPTRVVQIIDLGVQPRRAFDGKPKPPIQHIRITYEFLDEFCLDEDGNEMEDKPRWLSEDIPFYNLNADRATSTLRYKAIDPDDAFDGDFTQLAGSACLVTVVNNPGKGKNAGKIYNNIAGVATMRKRDKDKAVELVNESLVFLIDEPDKAAWGKLPQWLQDKIKGGIEFKGSALDVALSGGEAPKKEAKPEPDYDEDIEGEAAGGVDTDEDKPW